MNREALDTLIRRAFSYDYPTRTITLVCPEAIGSPAPAGKTYDMRNQRTITLAGRSVTELRVAEAISGKRSRGRAPGVDRDTVVRQHILEGKSYSQLGKALGGVSRQRGKQLVDELRSREALPLPREVRAEVRGGLQARRRTSRVPLGVPEERARVWKRKLTSKRSDSRKKGIEFSITLADLAPLPTVCPALGIPLVDVGDEHRMENSASIDRVDSTKGYIPGNVVVVSWRANRIKNDATPEELRKIAAYYSSLTTQII